MNLSETDRLLTVIQNVDNRRLDDATVLVWHEVIAGLPFADCLMAVTSHFRESSDYLMPVHIVQGAHRLDRDRRRAENERLAVEAAPPTDPRPLSDRSKEIQDFVNGIRSVLPPGDHDSLRYGSRHWRQVRQNRERQEVAEPNPHYDPTALARLDAGTSQ